MIRESRHMGVALGLDTLKFTSIDLDIRAVLDYLCLKSAYVLKGDENKLCLNGRTQYNPIVEISHINNSLVTK